MSERRQLINLAYRLLGSLADAEDVVQETYARWYAMSREQQAAINSPGAWLTKVASRICLDLLGSARARRERYVGEWIPEPVPDHAEWPDGRSGAGTADPADRVTLDESVNMAFLVVLESMTPAERVAFILHDVFRYPFAEVADIVGRSPVACRKLASSARRRIDASQDPATPTAQQADIIREFHRAWEAKDIDALIGLLDPDATMTGDGGGIVPAALRPIEGRDRVARRLLFIAELAVVVDRVFVDPEVVAAGRPVQLEVLPGGVRRPEPDDVLSATQALAALRPLDDGIVGVELRRASDVVSRCATAGADVGRGEVRPDHLGASRVVVRHGGPPSGR